MFEGLTAGSKKHHIHDDPSISLASIFRKLVFQFANEDRITQLLENSRDVDGIENIDMNDRSRMKIDRDGEIDVILIIY